MANYKVVDCDQLDADMTSVADVIREKSGSSEKMDFPTGFVDTIRSIQSGTGVNPSGEIVITTNGTYDVTDYASANVNVPSSGIDTSDATATADDMAKGKTAYVNGQKITGTLYEYTENTTEIFGHQNTEVSEKITDGIKYLHVRGQTTGKGVMRIGSWAKVRTPLSTLGDASASDVAAGKTFTSTAGLKVEGTAVLGTDTSDATASATDILSGKTAYVNGEKVTGSIESKAAATYTPGTADQAIASGQYLSGAQTVKGDANLVADNIKSGVSIFGVSGSYQGSGGIDTSDATAMAEDIAGGKTAYVKGEKITGTLSTLLNAGGEPSFQSPNIYLTYTGSKRYLMENGMYLYKNASYFGDATAADVVSGKTFTSSAGLKVTGTHVCDGGTTPTLQSKTVTPSESEQTVSPDSGYDGLSSVTVEAVSNTYVGSGVTKKAAQTITPGTADQTLAAGQYLNGAQTIKGDANLLAENIRNGVSIFGVAGSYEGSSSGLSVSYDETTGELTIGGESVAYDANSGNLTI